MYSNFRFVFPRLLASSYRRACLGALTVSTTAAAAATFVSAPSEHPARDTRFASITRHLPTLLSHADAGTTSSTDWHSVVHALRETQQANNLKSGFRATRRILPHTEGTRWALTIDFPISAGADAHAVLVKLADALGGGQPAQLTIDNTPTQHRTLLRGPDDMFEVSLSVPRVAPLETRVSVRILRGHSPVGDEFTPHEVEALVAAYKAGQTASSNELAPRPPSFGILDGRASVDFGPAKETDPPPSYNHGDSSCAATRRESSQSGASGGVSHSHSHHSHQSHGHSCDDDECQVGLHHHPDTTEIKKAGMEKLHLERKRHSAMNKLKELGVDVIDSDADLTWDVLAGYTEVKERIDNTLTLPLKHPEVYERIVRGTRARAECNVPKAVLYEGPPGCGKTLSARILASTIGVPFVHVKIESILSKFYGETTRKLSEILDAADQLGRCIVFLDECDGVGMRRSGATEVHEVTRRTLSVLLRFIDGMDGARQAIVLAATNHKEDLDAAFMSRFDVVVSFPLPDVETRVEMLGLYAKQLSQDELRHIAELTWGFSGRELLDICEEAERIRAGAILRELEEDEEVQSFELPSVSEYVLAVERKADHIVGRNDARFMTKSILAESALPAGEGVSVDGP